MRSPGTVLRGGGNFAERGAGGEAEAGLYSRPMLSERVGEDIPVVRNGNTRSRGERERGAAGGRSRRILRPRRSARRPGLRRPDTRRDRRQRSLPVPDFTGRRRRRPLHPHRTQDRAPPLAGPGWACAARDGDADAFRRTARLSRIGHHPGAGRQSRCGSGARGVGPCSASLPRCGRHGCRQRRRVRSALCIAQALLFLRRCGAIQHRHPAPPAGGHHHRRLCARCCRSRGHHADDRGAGRRRRATAIGRAGRQRAADGQPGARGRSPALSGPVLSGAAHRHRGQPARHRSATGQGPAFRHRHDGHA